MSKIRKCDECGRIVSFIRIPIPDRALNIDLPRIYAAFTDDPKEDRDICWICVRKAIDLAFSKPE